MKCKICDMGYDPRGKHLRQYHNLTSKEYYDIYILENEDERFCKVCGKEKYFLGGTRGYQKSKKHQGLCRECYLGSEEHKKLKKDKEIANQKVQNKKQSEKNKKEKIENKENYKYTCKICGEGTNRIASHLKKEHSLNHIEYCNLYNPTKLEQYCEKCNKKLEPKTNINRSELVFYKCCTTHKEGAIKREEKFRNTIEANGKNKKYNISNKKETREKISKKLKEKISKGEFTPDITNSWCHSRVEIELNNKIYKFRSSFEALYWLQFQNLSYETLRIPYVFNNENHTYILDFIDYSKNIIYEIKPSSLVEDEKNKAKFYYAQKWCEENNYIFKIITEEEIKQNLDSLTHRELQIIKENRKLLRTYNNFNKEVV